MTKNYPEGLGQVVRWILYVFSNIHKNPYTSFINAKANSKLSKTTFINDMTFSTINKFLLVSKDQQLPFFLCKQFA